MNATETLTVTASNGGFSTTVTLQNDNPGAFGNQALSETVTDAGFTVSGMSGGVGESCATGVSCVTGSICASAVCTAGFCE